VGADQTHFDTVRALGGADAETLSYPRFVPERRFPLDGRQITIGRRSRSRGIYPDIDLVGPPEDPGVSHLHALLVAQPDNTWAIVDLDSANGTYLNDPSSEPIEPQLPVPLNDGDVIYLGAWTALTIFAGS
jgi:pSer/pThr/pTyr-binding forkhead associated (FHA) protein